MTKKLKHDSLVKTIMADPVAAQEFLEYYLPTDFKNLVDLSKITVEKESYIEKSLTWILHEIGGDKTPVMVYNTSIPKN